jgi:hypothetical protein
MKDTKLTPLARAYERASLIRPPAPDVSTPAELLQCRESLSPDDRALLIRYARLLSAEEKICHRGTQNCCTTGPVAFWKRGWYTTDWPAGRTLEPQHTLDLQPSAATDTRRVRGEIW